MTTPPPTTDAWAVSPDEAAALLGLTRRRMALGKG